LAWSTYRWVFGYFKTSDDRPAPAGAEGPAVVGLLAASAFWCGAYPQSGFLQTRVGSTLPFRRGKQQPAFSKLFSYEFHTAKPPAVQVGPIFHLVKVDRRHHPLWVAPTVGQPAPPTLRERLTTHFHLRETSILLVFGAWTLLSVKGRAKYRQPDPAITYLPFKAPAADQPGIWPAAS
jgi:hypothetical protein